MRISPNTEIRHIPADVTQKLARDLDQNKNWKLVAERIMKPSSDSNSRLLLYNRQDLKLIKKSSDGPTVTLLNDWGSHGRRNCRPTIQTLIDILLECRLEKTAHFLTNEVIEGNTTTNESLTEEFARQNFTSLQIPSHSQHGESEPVERSSSPINNNSDYQNWTRRNSLPTGVYPEPQYSAFNIPESAININVTTCDIDDQVPRFELSYLTDITNGFDERKISNGGTKLGSGAFSQVFLARHEGENVAVKRINREFIKEFNNEVNILSLCEHENLLRILGVCLSDYHLCIVVEFMVNGTLQDRLACLNDTAAIPWQRRILIATDIIKGVAFLHIREYIHRDLKTANILLDEHWTAKLCDFGIAHEGPKEIGETSIETKQPVGTAVYMPKEAFFGIVSDKLDSYSFGVVLLELLTGMKPFDPSVESDLVTIVKNRCFDNDGRVNRIDSMLDERAGSWDLNVANDVFTQALNCLKELRKHRPTITEILPLFQGFVKTIHTQKNDS